MLLPLSLIIGLPTRSIGPYANKGKASEERTARKGRRCKDGDERKERTARTSHKMARKRQRGKDGEVRTASKNFLY